MKRGYKETEIGEIPEEWEVITLGDIGTTYTGLSGKSKSDFGSGFPYVPFMNINRNSHVDENFFDYVMLSDGEVQNTVEYGDILFTTSSETPDEVGMSSVVLCKIPKLYLNSFSFGFRPNKNVKLLPKYSEYIFRGKKSREQIEFLGQGSTRYNISKNQLLKMFIPLPPLPEQKKIAEVLSSVDESIRATQAVIEQAKVLKQGMLNQLLTKGIGHKKFKQTEIGEIPEEWEVKRLEDIVDKVIDNRGKTPPVCDAGYPLLECMNIVDDSMCPVLYPNKQKYVTADTFKNWFRSGTLHTGDIIFPTVGNIGLSAIIPESVEFSIAQNIFGISIKKKLNPEYIFWFTRSSIFIKKVLQLTMNAVQPSIKLPHLLQIYVVIPSYTEQCKIAEIMGSIDSAIQSNVRKVEELHIIKSGLMQDLLSGKKRVKV